MSPATLTKQPEMVELISLVASEHQIKLERVEEVIDAHHGKRMIPGTGKTIRFKAGRASVPAEWVGYLERHPDQFMQRKLVGPVDQMTALPGRYSQTQVVSGAQATRNTGKAPVEGWDEATGKQIGEWLSSKVVRDPEAALSYELAHRRRKMVVRAITEALLGDDPSDTPADPEPIAASFSAPFPEDI